MKKIIIVNNNMKVGGVQKSLSNLLWTLDDEKKYDVTLLLFSKVGEYINDIPSSIRIIECGGQFRYFGISQSETNGIKDTLVRGFLAIVSRMFGRWTAVRLMLKKQPMLDEYYDSAIAFLHNGRKKSFYGGVQDYVLHRVRAGQKIAFIHCDYKKSGADHPENNKILERFDKIAACSDGCRAVLELSLPELGEKIKTVKNCHRYGVIKSMAEADPVTYGDDFVNVLTVARLSAEKGVDRAIRALAYAKANDVCAKLHVVGNGSMRDDLVKLTHDLSVSDSVIFYGETENPYRYMKNADLLLVPSYHEAAPMVIDEARCLGLPVLTTSTTSSAEMVSDAKCGWVCENSDEALCEALCKAISDIEKLKLLKKQILERGADNEIAISQFHNLLET